MYNPRVSPTAFRKLRSIGRVLRLERLPLAPRLYVLIFDRLALPREIVPVNVEGRVMYVNPRDGGPGHYLFMSGEYERKTAELMRNELSEGMVMVDVGAHVGYFTLLAAEIVGSRGRVFAFEPEPSNYDLLVRNVGANRYENITPIQKAVSNESANRPLFLDPRNTGGHSIVHRGDGWAHVVVKVVRLDDFFAGYDRRIDFVKIDVEGSELDVLEGMGQILRGNKGLKCVVEYGTGRMGGPSPQAFLDMVSERYGLELSAIIDEKKRAISPATSRLSLAKMSRSEVVNLFFVAR